MHWVQLYPSHSLLYGSAELRPAFPIQSQVKVVGCDIVVLAISTHNLARQPSGTTNPVLSTSKQFLLDGTALRLRQIRFDVATNKKSDNKHIAVGRLVPNPLTSVALHIGQERATALVGEGKPTPGGTPCTSTTRMVTALVRPTAVRPTSIKGAAVAHAGRAVVVASSRSTVVALFDVEDPGTVPLDMAVWKFVLVH